MYLQNHSITQDHQHYCTISVVPNKSLQVRKKLCFETAALSRVSATQSPFLKTVLFGPLQLRDVTETTREITFTYFYNTVLSDVEAAALFHTRLLY